MNDVHVSGARGRFARHEVALRDRIGDNRQVTRIRALSAIALAFTALALAPAAAARGPGPAKKAARASTAQSASVGEVSRGKLVDPVALAASRTIKVNKGANFGTAELVTAIEAAVAHVHDRFPKTCAVKVGDLSRKTGGFLSGHRSHQSGRDADIGFWMADGRARGRFQKATAKTIDAARTWAFLESLLEGGDLEYAFIDWKLQKPLYEYARDVAKVSPAKLARWFQYPRPARQREGIIRHYPKHDNHLHIRVHARRSVARGETWAKAHPKETPRPRSRARHARGKR
ncbi:MAG: penicillin-insensitive murein endopeptidase [Deltaproteobacteria bacterium]|nr:penicillin-insensitive murein endopeptidase [Deltaproteobacteria bacterium]